MTTSMKNDGTTITFASDRPEYVGVWREEQNEGAIRMLRERLHEDRQTVKLILQPGDGTKYEFLLIPDPSSVTVSDAGREPEARMGVPGQLYVHLLHGMGKGLLQIAASNGLDGIRYRIGEYLEIGNPCTREALARALYYVWSEADE